MLKKYPSRYIKIPVFLCLPPSFPRWHEVIRLPSSSPHITDYSDMFSESSVCSGLLSLRLSHFSFLTWLLSLLSVLPSLMNNSILLAKLLLSCLTLCNHMDHSLVGCSPWVAQSRTRLKQLSSRSIYVFVHFLGTLLLNIVNSPMN